MDRLPAILTVLLLGLAVAGCSGIEMKKGDQARNNREIRQGSGMLTGSSGEFVIFRVDEAEPAEEDPPEEGAAEEEATE